MLFFNPNRALLQGMMAGALVLAGTSACSRPDRTESGDNSAVLVPDTISTAPGTSTGMDTTATVGTTTESGAVAGDTAPAQIQPDAPRAATAPPSAELQDTSLQGDSDAAGYRPMELDTANVPESDSARVSEDTSEVSVDTGETSVETADTSWTEMARDTSTAADQSDTTGAAPSGDVALQATADTGWTEAGVDTSTADLAVSAADTTDNAGRIRSTEDSTEVLGQEVATADTLESDPIRPPEDSTELHGNVISDETADEQVINPEDREVVATSDSGTDEVGAAAIAGNVTGTEAVALMTRQGATCIILDPESNEEVRWDMSSTPVTLNPCGLGSMNLSKVRTEGSGRQE